MVINDSIQFAVIQIQINLDSINKKKLFCSNFINTDCFKIDQNIFQNI